MRGAQGAGVASLEVGSAAGFGVKTVGNEVGVSFSPIDGPIGGGGRSLSEEICSEVTSTPLFPVAGASAEK